jgi:hypothetical protein
MTMKSEQLSVLVSAGGKILLEAPQQEWLSQNSDLSTALFAGKMMELYSSGEDGSEGFELEYLGFKSTLFPTQNEAKQTAPEFARAVLHQMTTLIGINS